MGCMSEIPFIWGRSLSGTPPYGKVRAVRILMECILVDLDLERFQLSTGSNQRKYLVKM